MNVDATRISQAFTGNGYITEIITEEVSAYLQGYKTDTTYPVQLVMRARFNPALESFWFGSVMELINAVTMIAIILSGAALIREKERGTIEHLLAMPVSDSEIMLSKIAATGLVVWAVTLMSVYGVIQGALGCPLTAMCGCLWWQWRFNFCHFQYGYFYGHHCPFNAPVWPVAYIGALTLTAVVGGTTARESMPAFIQNIMLLTPNTHFVMASQGVLYRGAGISVIYPQLLALLAIGCVFYFVALKRFKSTIGSMA